MSEELVFYTNPRSRGCVARWMLEEVGAPYRAEALEFGGSMKGSQFRRINPMGKVPALVHGRNVVTECAAICAYLADAFPEAALAPAPGARGAYYRWFFFGAGPLEHAVTNRALGVEVPEDKRVFVGYGGYDCTLDTLEAAVSAAPYLAGDRFSAVDVYTGSQIGWGLRFGTIEPRPAFEEYWARVSDRPAYARAAALDEALVPAPA